MIAELLFLLGIEYQEDESRTVCGIVAGLLHYTFLSKLFDIIGFYYCGLLQFLSHVQALSLGLPNINRVNALIEHL